VRRDINSALAVDELAELGGELAVSRVARSPECVPAERGDSVVVQVGDSSRVFLVNEICVPSGSTAWLSERCFSFLGLKSRPDDCDAWNAWDVWDLWLDPISLCALDKIQFSTHMNLHLPEMLTQRLLLLRGDILISKKNYTPLCNKQS
jgi:hypothetical protein